MNKPTHKHTHLQAAQSQRTDQSLQKSVLFANALPTDNQSDREMRQQITRVTVAQLHIFSNFQSKTIKNGLL